jgi:tetratricopeptide (TPR) repeat protein
LRADELVVQAGLRLVDSDEAAFIAYLDDRWTPDELAELLNDHNLNPVEVTPFDTNGGDFESAGFACAGNIDVVKTAAIALGLVGTMAQSSALSRTLHHDDYFVVNIAERAMWNIWFRGSTPQCRELLKQAIDAMHHERFDEAERTLDRILLRDAHFAEASNHRAILHYLTGRFASSLMACRRTLALNPYHFGAAAGIGHNYVQLSQFAEAEAAYRHALRLHPRMEGVRQQLRRAREADLASVPRDPWRRPH